MPFFIGQAWAVAAAAVAAASERHRESSKDSGDAGGGGGGAGSSGNFTWCVVGVADTTHLLGRSAQCHHVRVVMARESAGVRAALSSARLAAVRLTTATTLALAPTRLARGDRNLLSPRRRFSRFAFRYRLKRGNARCRLHPFWPTGLSSLRLAATTSLCLAAARLTASTGLRRRR